MGFVSWLRLHSKAGGNWEEYGWGGRTYLFGTSVVVEVLVEVEVGVDVGITVGTHSVQDVDVEEVCWMGMYGVGCCAVHHDARCRKVKATRK